MAEALQGSYLSFFKFFFHILMNKPFPYGLLQDIEYSFLCYKV